ncbi:substrate-binding periplasmic protein [Marinobacter adhaerens]|uniref:substrate-binding periplasmic protein n=1 Tax=Marinobacter adhaerens TaxID=1033846 RepID=UPI000B242883|nr:transporter substrate-binding domain-containing protein [Marinobacter adhaerens]
MHRYLVSVILLVAMSAEAGAVTPKIRVGVGAEFESVVSDENGRLKGVIAEPYNCLLEGAGYSYEFVTLPLARLVHELRAGNIDVGLPLVHDSSRDDYATFGNTVIKSSYLRISVRSNQQKPDEPEARYVYVRGFAGRALLRGLDGRSFEVSEWSQAIAMLRRQRADYVLITEKTYGALTEFRKTDLIAEKVSDLNVAFYVRKALPKLAEALNQSNNQCQTAKLAETSG